MAHAWSKSDFASNTDPTWENTFKKYVSIDSIHYVVECSDFERPTQGSLEPEHCHASNFDGVVIAFDLTDYESFELAHERVKLLYVGGSLRSTSFVLVGTKLDLAIEPSSRKVPKTEAAELAAEVGTTYFEVSSKTHTQVDECFNHLVALIIARESQNQPDKTSSHSKSCAVM